MKGDLDDPKALIREAYVIEGITIEECRSVFLDWALSIPLGSDSREILQRLVVKYEEAHPDHPMTTVLREGLDQSMTARRRGGWRSRTRPAID